MARPFKCPCGATNSVAKGYRRTKTMGLRRVRRCRACGKKFTPKNQRPVEGPRDSSDSTPTPVAQVQPDTVSEEESSSDDRHHQPGVQAD